MPQRTNRNVGCDLENLASRAHVVLSSTLKPPVATVRVTTAGTRVLCVGTTAVACAASRLKEQARVVSE